MRKKIAVNDDSDSCVMFDSVVDKALGRRNFLLSGVKVGMSAFALSLSDAFASRSNSMDFGFKQIGASTKDTVVVPEGFTWERLVSWGDPLWSDIPPFDQKTRGTAYSQNFSFGDNADGMKLFVYEGREILVVNNEYSNLDVICGNRSSKKPENFDDVSKVMNAHGVSILEIRREKDRWIIVQDSKYNRRITPFTPMKISGPASGHKLLKTTRDQTGTEAFGTWNNCGSGKTPWGTYLACEENFNFYFSSTGDDFYLNQDLKRYGISKADRGYRWSLVDDRFDISKNPNEPNRVGYVVEIDPKDPESTPIKRTALGRLKHENAEVVIGKNGQVVVYMGDDERGEYIYRFVSRRSYTPDQPTDDLLDDGKLFVAKFHEDFSGEWLELNPESTGMPSMAEICINTRQAATSVEATTMDRPEWIAVHPVRSEVYCALTNNKYRGVRKNLGGDQMGLNGINPRGKNIYGHIIKWTPYSSDHSSDGFKWDIFAMAGNPKIHAGPKAGSKNIDENNMFNSPDGLMFDSKGFMWIGTDGNYSNLGDFSGMGNNQLLVADTNSGEIRRFLVGPRGCEITGLEWSYDRRTLFVGIQHPGAWVNSDFPDGLGKIPRASVVAVSRNDRSVFG